MAWSRGVRVAGEGGLDFSGLLYDPVEVNRELAVVFLGNLRQHLDAPEDVELAFKFRRSAVEHAQLARHPPQVFWLDDLSGRDMPPVDETGHEVAFRLDKVDDL